MIYYTPTNIFDIINTTDHIYASSVIEASVYKINDVTVDILPVLFPSENLINLSSENKIISYHNRSYNTCVDFPNADNTSFDVPFVSKFVQYNEHLNTIAFVSGGSKLNLYKVSDWTLFKEKDFDLQVSEFYNLGHLLVFVKTGGGITYYIPQFDYTNSDTLKDHEFICANSESIISRKNGLLYTTDVNKVLSKAYLSAANIIYRKSDTFGYCVLFDTKLSYKYLNNNITMINFPYSITGIAEFDLYNKCFYTQSSNSFIRHFYNEDEIYVGQNIYPGDWWNNFKFDNNMQELLIWTNNKIQSRKIHEIYELEVRTPSGIQKGAGINSFNVSVNSTLRKNQIAKRIYYTGSNATPTSSAVNSNGINKMPFTNDLDGQNKFISVKI